LERHPSVDADLRLNQFVQTNGVNLHVVQAGPSDGELVILLHGWPEFWLSWKAQIPALAQAGYRVWVPDQRGYNLSDKPAGVQHYGLGTLSKDVVGLIDAAGVDTARIVGHDWGAAVGWHLGIHHPDRVERLAVLNVPQPNVFVKTLRRSVRQRRRSWYMFAFQVPWLPEWLLTRRRAALLKRLMKSSSRAGTYDDDLLTHYETAWLQPGAMKASLNWYRHAVRAGIRRSKILAEAKASISSPTLLIWGKRDLALLSEMAEPSIARCENGQLIFYDLASHWVQHEESAAVNENLLDFLR
jgi:pimeloyl-ACP methyl ester carboxylesterase